jgi:hypothetical protein
MRGRAEGHGWLHRQQVHGDVLRAGREPVLHPPHAPGNVNRLLAGLPADGLTLCPCCPYSEHSVELGGGGGRRGSLRGRRAGGVCVCVRGSAKLIASARGFCWKGNAANPFPVSLLWRAEGGGAGVGGAPPAAAVHCGAHPSRHPRAAAPSVRSVRSLVYRLFSVVATY